GPAAADLSIFVASVGFDEEASLDNGVGAGVRWGKSSSIIGGETSLMVARPSRTGSLGSESTTAIFYDARLIVNIPTGTMIAPFLGIGLGAITVLSTDLPSTDDRTDAAQAALSTLADTQTNRALSYGGGARYALNEKLSLRVDIRRYSVFSVTALAKDALKDQILNEIEDEIGVEVPEGAADQLLNNSTEDKTVAHNEFSIGINISF
ncbi:MAG: outer membrane beta-barrel protein, partial [Candidatus Latescibacteria bacterium]|nr:outer membrane beta-barrel protein [Candidatus Latescibacterota bacterium]